MKKFIIGLVLITSTLITMYTVFYWEPKGQGEESIKLGEVSTEVKKESNTKDKEIVNDNKAKEVNSNKSFFKVAPEKVVKDLFEDNTSEVLSIASHLSTSDIGRLEESLKSDDKEEGIKRAINILKTRLPDEKYKRLKEILLPYVDFEVIKESV